MHVFPFSPREGTRAAALSGRLRGDEIRARSAELHRVAARMKAEHLARAVGQTRQVLWESGEQTGGGEAHGVIPRDVVPLSGGDRSGGARRFAGYTDTYLRVETEVAMGIELENRIEDVQLAAADGDRLIGVRR